MTWFKGLETIEFIFIALIFLAYLGYFFRLKFISGFFKSTNAGFYKKLPLRVLYLTLIFISLLGPSFGSQTREIKVIGKDIYLAVDLSKSMDCQDVNPSRIRKVKNEIKRLLDEFNSDRMGLIIFSSEAFVQCPLTYDQSALSMFIETIHTGLVPNAGTELKEPLELAHDKMTSGDKASGKNQAQIIVLISDGEDFGKNAENIVRKIKKDGIKLFCLGVGTEKGGPIPSGSRNLIDDQGKEVITKLNREALKRLSIETGGKYFEISKGLNETGKLINAINGIEGELQDSRQVDASSNKYIFFLLPALFLVLLDVFFTSRTIKI